MARGNRGIALRHLNTLFSVGMIGGLTDAQLLERFTSHRDETAELAFRALVERHGPMVLRVCRAVLRDADDADDAFQATFLVLVRRAGLLWVHDSLGPWLQQVAYRTASCARLAAARRRKHERHAAELRARAPDEVQHDDVDEVVHEEVGRLPERYRDAVVLCLLEGLTPEQAAGHLKCPVGTVHSRLARGREQLRGRLTRRGLAVPAGLFAVGLGRNGASAAVPPALTDSTIRAALRMALAQVAAGAVPASVAPLAATDIEDHAHGQDHDRHGNSADSRCSGGRRRGARAPGAARPKAAAPERNSQATPVSKAPVRLSQPASKPSNTDSLGDPLPAGARLRLGTSRFRPPSPVTDLALSPDETAVVTVGQELIVWDAKNGKERWRASGREYGFDPPGPAYGMRALAFSSDSSRFYTPGKQNEVVVWETASGRHEVLKVASAYKNPTASALANRSAPRSIDVTPDGKKLAVGSAGGVVVCDLQGKVLYEIANVPEDPLKFDKNDRLAFAGPLQPRAFLAGR